MPQSFYCDATIEKIKYVTPIINYTSITGNIIMKLSTKSSIESAFELEMVTDFV